MGAVRRRAAVEGGCSLVLMVGESVVKGVCRRRLEGVWACLCRRRRACAVRKWRPRGMIGSVSRHHHRRPRTKPVARGVHA